MKKQLCEVVNEVLDTLTPREAKILRLRFGFETDKDQTLDEVGKMFDLTRERVRQIEAKALRKLRHFHRADHLVNVWESFDHVIKPKDIRKPPEEKPKTTKPKKKTERKPIQIGELYSDIDFVLPGKDGWVNGKKHNPKYAGIYERESKGFTAYSRWDGKYWLKGSKDYDNAYWMPMDEISAYQEINWRSIRERT